MPGTAWIFTANTSASIGPITNAGMASMPKVVTPAMRSKIRFGCREATSARGMAIAKAMICEKRISSMSTGKAFAMVVVTFWWVRNDVAEVPVQDVVQPGPVLL